LTYFDPFTVALYYDRVINNSCISWKVFSCHFHRGFITTTRMPTTRNRRLIYFGQSHYDKSSPISSSMSFLKYLFK